MATNSQIQGGMKLLLTVLLYIYLLVDGVLSGGNKEAAKVIK